MSPGPSFIVVARNALTVSRAHGIATALGTALGVALFALLASLGVTTLLRSSPTVLLVFKLAGGAFLMYLTVRIWQSSDKPLETLADDNNQPADMPFRRAFFQGLVVQTSNPKTALVIAGIFAAFVPAEPPVFTSLLVALVAFVIDFSWYAVVAITLSNQRSRRVYQKAKKYFDRLTAVFILLVAIKLLTANLTDI